MIVSKSGANCNTFLCVATLPEINQQNRPVASAGPVVLYVPFLGASRLYFSFKGYFLAEQPFELYVVVALIVFPDGDDGTVTS